MVRNNYFQPALRELMAHSVGVWESDPQAFSYHPVGYMQISHEAMREDVTSIYEQQKAIGYSSEFIEGGKDCMTYMRGLLSDWRAEGITSVLHEKKGGYANNTASVYGLAGKAEGPRRAHHDGRGSDRLRARQQFRRGDGRPDRPGDDQVRAGRCRGRALGQDDLGHARPAARGLDQGARRRDARRHPDLALLVSGGGRGRVSTRTCRS